jgi:hypothetical protein
MDDEIQFLPTHKTGFSNHDPCIMLIIAIKPINEKDNKWVCNVPNICLVPLCTFARLHTYNLTKANQSQARVQKRAVGNTFSRRYIKVRIQTISVTM